MFKEIGQFVSLMKQLPANPRGDGAACSSALAQITAEGDAGGGMVKVRVNGTWRSSPAPSATRP